MQASLGARAFCLHLSCTAVLLSFWEFIWKARTTDGQTMQNDGRLCFRNCGVLPNYSLVTNRVLKKQAYTFFFFLDKISFVLQPWRKPIARFAVFAVFQPPWQDLPTYKWSKHSQWCTILNTPRDQTSCCCLLETEMSGAVPPNYGSHAEFSIGIWNCQFMNTNLYFGPRM